MKILQNTLYITAPEQYLSLDGENIVVSKERQEVARLPLHNIGGIVTFGHAGASPSLMGACARRGISISFLSRSGRFLARVVGEEHGNVLLRRQQYRIADQEPQRLFYAKSFIIGKLYNSKWVLERTCRDHGMRVEEAALKDASQKISAALQMVGDAQDLGQLRGIEGEAAAVYFGVFDQMILQQKQAFAFHGRNKRPPRDNCNALLSFIYTLLAHDVASALETVGLDPYVGFMHSARPGRISLALDLMEELRSVYADRFVLSCINKNMVKESGFAAAENGAVRMDEETRRTILSAWQSKKQEPLKHPFLEEKICWGLVPIVQAQLLARTIRGDLDAYPPFLWK